MGQSGGELAIRQLLKWLFKYSDLVAELPNCPKNFVARFWMGRSRFARSARVAFLIRLCLSQSKTQSDYSFACYRMLNFCDSFRVYRGLYLIDIWVLRIWWPVNGILLFSLELVYFNGKMSFFCTQRLPKSSWKFSRRLYYVRKSIPCLALVKIIAPRALVKIIAPKALIKIFRAEGAYKNFSRRRRL